MSSAWPSCRFCSGCDEVVPQEGRLFLWPRLDHTRGKLLRSLQEGALTGSLGPRSEGLCLVIRFTQESYASILQHITQAVTPEEARALNVLEKEGSADPELADFGRVVSLQELSHKRHSSWLVDLLQEGRYTTYFQPIFFAQDPRRVYAHEALFRGLDESGGVISAGRMFSAARDSSLLFQLDLHARLSAIHRAAHYHLKTNLFINFNPASIYDPAYCLKSSLLAIDQSGLDPNNIVFEVVESDRTHDLNHLLDILRHYREAGFRVALDDLGAGYSSLNLMHQLHPDLIKLDMELVRNVHQDPYKATIASKILEMADQLGIKTLAEGIEKPEELAWIQQQGVEYVQGFLIAKPQPDPIIL